jgi:uncharacterized protein YyaL (SSP411 family)
MERWTNRLIHETSPYLLQHAHNPVDWYPWGDEAFARAREADKPIFLSIGYAACHWCHVMERESFEDAQIAAFLNTHFVAIKVDREERPDVDAVYIQALVAINGQAGWPASLFLLPDLRPFTGATYLPPRPSHGLPSFQQVLERISGAWRSDRASIEAAGERLLGELAKTAPKAEGSLDHRDVISAIGATLGLFDEVYGGFGHGAKFPQPAMLELLLLGAADGIAAADDAVSGTLRAMDAGGLQDQLGGGFHRYCVDRDWVVPHFEKMLYDNAQLVRLYARASALAAAKDSKSRNETPGLRPRDDARAWIRVVRDAVQWLLTDLRDPGSGAFRSSRDADDPGGEGFFYTFTPAEAREALGKDVPLPYGIDANGNFDHGRTVLHTDGGLPPRPVREKLRAYRDRRPPPALDDKRVVAWNGLAIGALAEAGRLFGFDEWVAAAARCAEVVLASRDGDGALPRVIGGSAPGTLDDHAMVADGLLDLFLALPWDYRWLDAARQLTEVAIARFADPAGGFFQSAARADLVVRRVELHDGAEPSGAGRMSSVLRRLAAYGVAGMRERLDAQLQASVGFMATHRAATPELWGTVRALTAQPLEVVIAGDAKDPRVQQMLRVFHRTWRPHAVLAVVGPGQDVGRYELLEGKSAGEGPLAYVCRAGACGLPVRTVEELAAALG